MAVQSPSRDKGLAGGFRAADVKNNIYITKNTVKIQVQADEGRRKAAEKRQRRGGSLA